MILGLNLVDKPETDRIYRDQDLIRNAYFRFHEMEQMGLHDLAGVARVHLEKLIAQIDTVTGVRDHVRSNILVAFRADNIQNQSLITEAGMMTPDLLSKGGDIRMASWYRF